MKQLLLLEEGDQCIEGDNYLCTSCMRGILWKNRVEESTNMIERFGYFCDNSSCGAIFEEYEVAIVVRTIKEHNGKSK